MKNVMKFLAVIIIFLNSFQSCYSWNWPNYQHDDPNYNQQAYGGENEAKAMSNRRQVYYNNHNLDLHQNPQSSYYFRQNGGNYILQQQQQQQQPQNHHSHHPMQTQCNCMKLKLCNPIMVMAQKMFYGFIADYINTQLKVYQCNFHEGEMYVCCPNQNNDYYQNQYNKPQQKSWTWESSEENEDRGNFNQFQPPPQNYGMQQYVSYPIHSFFPYTKNKKLKTFTPKHEDQATKKNCPPPISDEFTLPSNHTFYGVENTVERIGSTTSTTSTTTTTTTKAPSIFTPATQELPSKLALINGKNCGQSSGVRIIGGEDAGVGRFLWMARLAYRNKSSNTFSYRCAGSLISDRWIVSAAHCVSNLIDSLELAMVRLGDVDADVENECNEDRSFCVKEEDFEIEQIITHPRYNNPRFSNDIALLKLKCASDCTRSLPAMAPICLPVGDYERFNMDIPSGQNGIVAGFGASSKTTNAQNQQLQWIRLNFFDTTQCAAFYANFSTTLQSTIRISNFQLCVQGRDNGDACAGDSGGPLMNDNAENNDRIVLLGIVSFGPRSCGLANFPGVYTRLSSYIPWILENIE